jgi:UDP-N-acetylmuramate dehydrogenase
MEMQENVALSRHTSLHVGGPARYFVSVKNDEEVQEALTFATEKNLPFFVLGKGSNTIFSDDGFPGVIIQMADRTLTAAGNKVTAASGTFMRQLVNFAHDHGLVGLEELAGIPGTVGGAVRGNAGTWQTETKDVLDSVEILRPQAGGIWEKMTLLPSDCDFGYRHSAFKQHRDWVILRATFALQAGDIASAKQRVQKDLTDRHLKQPYNAPSAGSIFKNPDKEHGVFSGQLIEKSGLKGHQKGGAAISEKHGNFIVNTGAATGNDVISLIGEIQAVVRLKHGIDLQPEVEIVRTS